MDKKTSRKRVEYIWLDGNEDLPHLRSKTRFVEVKDSNMANHGIPSWNFDGGSTGQGNLQDSDRKLICVRTYPDPFVDDGILALCEVTYHTGGKHPSNTRSLLSSLNCMDSWGIGVGFEQEVTFVNPADFKPLGFLLSPSVQGEYYCGVGAMRSVGRFIMDEFEKACSKAGIKIDGINAEVMPGQWEWQTAPYEPLKAADDLWVCRYIIERIGEPKPLIISYDPKPHIEFNGAGCHTNVSTRKMREKFDEEDQRQLMEILEQDHEAHMKVCGVGLERRMTGDCETSEYKKFTWGVGDRGASVRIPLQVATEKKGYFEDRRPCANIDPYLVLSSLISSIKKSNLL